jgi:16S rRNA (cytidine1402-2'-O)-methyltransferase
MGILYVVATPIGNLEDISRRAIRILQEVSLIAAEDTRKTRRLLNAYDIKTPMTSYFEHSKLTKLDYILDRLDESDVALVSDAGTPGLNDPGYDLIVAAAKRGITVTPIPGPSVVVAALVVSGLPTDRFTYLGFLPRKAGDRRRFLKSVVDESATLVILETPHRLKEALTDISDILGDRRIAVCRELTKLHEEIFRGTVSGAIAHFTAPRGEFALVIDGKREITTPALTDNITGRLQNMRRSGMTAKEAIAGVSKETGLPRKKLYQVWLTLSPSSGKEINK